MVTQGVPGWLRAYARVHEELPAPAAPARTPDAPSAHAIRGRAPELLPVGADAELTRLVANLVMARAQAHRASARVGGNGGAR